MTASMSSMNVLSNRAKGSHKGSPPFYTESQSCTFEHRGGTRFPDGGKIASDAKHRHPPLRANNTHSKVYWLKNSHKNSLALGAFGSLSGRVPVPPAHMCGSPSI